MKMGVESPMRNLNPVLLTIVCVACTTITTRPSADSQLLQLYRDYHAAVDADDLAKAKGFLSEGKRRDIESLPPDEGLAKLSVLAPLSDIGEKKHAIHGDEAILIVRAKLQENDATGRITFAKEGSDWKIAAEMWNIGSGSEFLEKLDDDSGRTDSQRQALRKLREKGYPMPQDDQLSMAALQGDLDAVKLFVEAGFPVDAPSNSGTPLIAAATYGKTEVVRYLLDHGANVNAVDEVNCTALMRAADHCDATDVIELLLSHGAHTDVKAAGGATALELAEYSHCDANASRIRKPH